jgi:preprotein translocase subunit SecF
MRTIYKIFFIFSMLLTVAALVITVAVWKKTGGDFLSVDFRGGSVLEVAFVGDRPATEKIREVVTAVPELENATVTPSDQKNAIIQSQKITDETRQAALSALTKELGEVTQQRFDDIGPTIGKQLRNKSIQAILLLLAVIIVYISIVFRTMSRVLSPWALGVAAVAALIHDVIVPVGVFSLLGYYGNVEVTAVFVAAALTILGYSLSDTVVVFDRVRENVLKLGGKERFSELVHKSVMQTLTRSINTSVTTLLSLLAIFFFGGESIKYFALAMAIGVVSGTYSSIFIATPIVIWWHERRGGPKK